MKKVSEIVTEKILARMEEAKNSGEQFHWVKPFAEGAPTRAYSYETKLPYSGINRLLLDNSEYLTFKQIQKINQKKDGPQYQIRKGAHGNMVCYYDLMTIKNKDTGEPEIDEFTGKEKKRGFLKYYNVFSREDVIDIQTGKNLPSQFDFKHYTHQDVSELMQQKLDTVNRLFNFYCKKYGIDIEIITDGTQAYFSHNMRIRFPTIDNFHSLYSWAHTIFHEMSHSTGMMLGRFNDMTPQSVEEQMQSYSREELVAELSSEMICADLGIPDDSNTPDNSVAYISGWSSYLKDRPNEIISAAAKAEKASMFILECLKELELEEQKGKNQTERSEEYDR